MRLQRGEWLRAKVWQALFARAFRQDAPMAMAEPAEWQEVEQSVMGRRSSFRRVGVDLQQQRDAAIDWIVGRRSLDRAGVGEAGDFADLRDGNDMLDELATARSVRQSPKVQ